MTDRTETIGVRVTPAEKEKFQKEVDESNEFESVSRMMRVLAHRHIAADGQQEATIDADEIVDAVTVAMSDVTERLERVEDSVAEVDAAVRDSDDISAMTHEIVSNLPVHESGDAFPEPGDIDGSGDNIQFAQALSTAGAWATYLDADEGQVRRALARAQQFPDVKYVEGSMGYRRYYRVEDSI